MKHVGYNVFDTKENKYIKTFLNNHQVGELLGVNEKLVNKYCRENLMFHKRYCVENSIVEEIPDELLKEWDDYCNAVRKNYLGWQLRGIKIVSEKRKR